MDDRTLLRIALACACVGIASLYVIMQFQTMPLYSVREVKDLADNAKVAVEGTITNLRITDKAISFDIEECNPVVQRVVYFRKNPSDYPEGMESTSAQSTLDAAANRQAKVFGSIYKESIILTKIEFIASTEVTGKASEENDEISPD